MIAIAGYELTPERIRAAIAVAIVHLLIGYALLSGLQVPVPRVIEQSLRLFAVLPQKPEPSPPPPRPKPAVDPRPNGAAAPPNRRSKATEIASPPPVVLVPKPPPVVVAEKPSTGAEQTSGAAPLPGPGTGAGGAGDGAGSGTGGDGDGGGGSPLRQIGGRISGRDYPEAPFRAHIGGTVWVRYVVGVRGRVEQCSIQRSSGNAELDATTCRLIIERFRFRPRRDASGKPVPGIVVEDHTWVVDNQAIEEQ